MAEKNATGSGKPPEAPREPVPEGTGTGSDSTAVPMPPQQDDASTNKVRPEREPAPKDLLRVFSYARKWDYVAYIIGSISSIAAGVTLPLMFILMGELIDKFQRYFLPNTDVTQKDFEEEINRLCLFLFGLFLLRFVCNYINKVVFRMVGIRMSSAIRADFLRALFAQSIHVLDSLPPGAAATTITTTANVLQNGISEKFGILIEFLAMAIAGIVIAFVYSWSLALVTFSVILFILLTLGILLPLIVKGVSRTTKAESKATAIASEAISSMRMIAACGAEARTHSRYIFWSEEARRLGQKTAPLIALQFGLVFFAMWAVFGLALWYGTKSFMEGRLDGIRAIVIVLMSCMLVVMSLERISTPILAMGKATVAACQFFTVIDAPAPSKGHLKEPDVSATDDITFDNVTFAYPGRPHVKVLDDLSLTIEAGKLTAIVGPSGSGKSTIVGLIQRWYSLSHQYVIERAIDQEELQKRKKREKKEKKRAKKGATAPAAADSSDDEEPRRNEEDENAGPQVELKGRILSGKTPVDDIEATWWRTQIGLVQQEPFLFNDTIYNNVAYGLIGSQWEDDPEEKKLGVVREACQEAFADEFIDKLPEGYDTHVGESGAKLSGGQRQRVAIARSIVRKPKLLILDEATSAIDVRGEKIVQAALDRVAQGRTTITIAHRLSTIKKADRIVVLKKGRIAESGTHQSLLGDPAGVYSGLVHAQKLNLGEGVADSEEEEGEVDVGAVLSREKSVARSDGGEAPPRAERGSRNFANSFGRLLVEQRSRWPYYILTIFFAACTGAAPAVMAYLFAQIIAVFNYINDFDKMREESSFWSLMWVMFAIGMGLAYFGVGWVSTHVSYYVSAAYRNEYFESILFQKLSFFDQDENTQGTLTSRVSSDPKHMEEMSGINMAFVYSSIFGLFGALIIAFYFGWKLALVAFFVTMPIMITSGFFRLKYELEFDKMNDAVFDESSKFAAETIGAFRTVSSLTLEGTIAARYERLLAGHVSSAFRKALRTSLIFAFSDSSSIGCQALIFWYGGRLLASHEYDPVAVIVIMMAVVQGAEGAGQGLSFGPNAAQAAAASNRILDMRASRSCDAVVAGEGEGVPDAEGGLRIELRDVHFKYPTRDTPVFRGLDLTVEKGQFAALVGASGCGKTSIISLLERFYDPSKGRILANGRDIRDVNVYSYRSYLSLVAQEPTLFQGTLRENILLGVDAASVPEERLHAVCRDASIHEFIASLPEGYNTPVGSKGVSLSGGQKQRVAIARALIRDPSVLLLDEATSSLDSESERLVQAAFERAGRGRTMVVVAHRLATVQNADVIFVLGEGKLLEKGSHAELLKKKGVYWNMCQSQALDR